MHDRCPGIALVLMRFITSAILFLAPFAKALEQDFVVKLSGKDDFKAKVENAPVDRTILVEFYAPWCGHCKNLAPIYSTVAKHFAELEKNDNVALASFNCDNDKVFCQDMGIEGYPTLKFFKGGNNWKYDGPREAQGMISYVKKQLLPLISEISADQVETFSQSDQVVVIASVAGNSTEFKTFERVATRLRNEIVAANTMSKEANAKPTLSLYKKFDEGFAKYDGPWEEEALFTWISTESTPVMAEINQALYLKYMTEGGPLVYFFYNNTDQKSAVGKVVENVARLYKGKINTVSIDGKAFGQHMISLNGEAGRYPSLLAHRVKEDLKFDFGNQAYTESNVKEFFEKLHQDKLVPKYRSDPIPKTDEGPIKVVVNENFEKVVLDVKKDVFLEVYAPWCGVCKRVAPLFEKLGEIYKKHSDKIIVAKLNGDSNDLPRNANLAITGFPTFVLYKSESNEKVVMNPTDSLDEMVDFISKNANHKIDVTKELKAIKEKKEEKGEGKKEKEEL